MGRSKAGYAKRDAAGRSQREQHRWSSAVLYASLALLPALGIGREQAEWQEWTDCNVLVVHNILLGQWKALHDRLRLGNIPGIQQEDDSATIATRIPLTNLPIEIELHGLPDFSWHDGHDLFATDARLHGKDDHHPGGCRRGGLCLGNGWMGHGSSSYQS